MSYSKHNFQDGQILYSEKLNEMDEQIIKNESSISKTETDVDNHKNAINPHDITPSIIGASQYSMRANNKLYVDQFLGILKSYYDNRKSADGNNIFSYGHTTVLDKNYVEGNNIDCSSFVGLGLLGIPFNNSPYSNLNSKTEDNSDTGNDTVKESDNNTDNVSTSGVSTTISAGDYPWVIDFRNIYYKKNNNGEPDPVRTASQLCEMMQDAGWAIKYDNIFSNIRRGDIIFYAKIKSGTDEYVQPNRYKHISHVAVVSSVYENNGSYGIDESYPFKHTMFEVSDFGGIVLNTTLEKRTPNRVVAIMRPDFGSVAIGNVSGSINERTDTNSIDEVSQEGLYFLMSSNTGTLPSDVTALTGAQLEVKRTYNKWGRLYNVLQTLTTFSTATSSTTAGNFSPQVYVRTNYCYASGTYKFRKNFWSAWSKLT